MKQRVGLRGFKIAGNSYSHAAGLALAEALKQIVGVGRKCGRASASFMGWEAQQWLQSLLGEQWETSGERRRRAA